MPAWLVLIVRLPPRPSSLRVRAWRRLRAVGAVALKNSVYLLPFTAENQEHLQWLAQEVQKDRGEATLLKVDLPVYLFVVVPYPWFDRFSENRQIRAFVVGVTAAAAGAIAGACFVLARRAIVDVPTLLLAGGALGLLVWRRIPEPVVIVAAAVVGLAIFSVR